MISENKTIEEKFYLSNINPSLLVLHRFQMPIFLCRWSAKICTHKLLETNLKFKRWI